MSEATPRADAEYHELWDGLEAVFKSDEADQIMQELAANITAVEKDNQSRYDGLRSRSQSLVNRAHVIIVTSAAAVVWAFDRSLFAKGHTLGAPLAATMTLTVAAAVATLFVALWADWSYCSACAERSTVTPFVVEPSTAASLRGYRMWTLPPRWDAALRSDARLDRIATRTLVAHWIGLAAIICLVASLGLIAACGLMS